MNKLLISIVATLALAATGFAQAQDTDTDPTPEKKAQGQKRGPQAMPFGPDMMRALKKLDLSEEQKTSIKAILEMAREDLHPVMVEMRDGQKQIRELVRAETYEASTVATLAERAGELATTRIILTSRAMSDVRAQLSAEQLEKFDAMAARMKARHGKQRAHHGKKRAHRPPKPEAETS